MAQLWIDTWVRWLCWLIWQWRSLSRVLIRRRWAVSFVPALIHRCCDAAEVGVACTGLSLMACVGCAMCVCVLNCCLTEYGLFSVGPSLTLDGRVLFGPPVWCPREEARRILVSSSGTHSVRSDRVAPDSLRRFRGLYFTIPRRA